MLEFSIRTSSITCVVENNYWLEYNTTFFVLFETLQLCTSSKPCGNRTLNVSFQAVRLLVHFPLLTAEEFQTEQNSWSNEFSAFNFTSYWQIPDRKRVDFSLALFWDLLRHVSNLLLRGSTPELSGQKLDRLSIKPQNRHSSTISPAGGRKRSHS